MHPTRAGSGRRSATSASKRSRSASSARCRAASSAAPPIARLLVQAPSIYLLDEPTNHLDPAQQLGILERLRPLTRSGAAVIASLHDPNLALRFADRACLLSGNGDAEMVDCAALGPEHLGRLYGLRYAETRLGAQRFMAPD